MSRTKKIWICAALICVVLGAAVSGGTLAAIGFDFSRLNTMKFVTHTYEVEDPNTHESKNPNATQEPGQAEGPNTYEAEGTFSRIGIDAAEADIHLVRSDDGTCRVVCVEGDKITHTVTVEGDTLTIVRHDERKWYERAGIYWGDMSITVYLPKDSYTGLEVSTMSGDVIIPEEFTFDTVQVDTMSGDISFTAAANKSLRLKTLSGDLTVTEMTTEAVTLQTTSGDMELTGLSAGSMSISTTSGDIELKDVTATTLSAQGTSGEIESTGVFVTERMELETVSGDVYLTRCVSNGWLGVTTVSGDVKLSACDCDVVLSILTTSGDITGTLLTPKQFLCSTNGKVSVPFSKPVNSVFEANSISGDIRIKIEG